MSTTTTKPAAAPTKVVTGKARLSYMAVWEPKAVEEGNEKKYSVSVLIPKTDTTTKAKLDAAINAAKQDGKDSKWGGKIPQTLKLPLRDGDVEREDDPAYRGHWFFNATSKSKPGIVDKNLNAIIDQDEVYSGCYGRVAVNFYAFNSNGNKGVAAGLNNIQKLADGEPLAGKSRAEDDFAEEFNDAASEFE